MTARKARSPRSGAAAVEFAIILPVFLALLAGIIEFGQAFKVEHALSNACRRATRAATFDGATFTDVKKNVLSHCSKSLGNKAENVKVEVSLNGATTSSLSDASQGDEIRVTVSVPYKEVGFGFYSNWFSDSVLSVSCILERE